MARAHGLLGHFEDGWLRGGPVRRWLPRAYAEPIDAYPWDGVTNLRLFSKLQESVVVGVY